jgi:hypothetical protein
MTDCKFRTYVAEAHPLAFDRSRGIVIVQTRNPLTTGIIIPRFPTQACDRVGSPKLPLGGSRRSAALRLMH